MPAPPGSNTKWIEGLRGLASLLVVTAHVTRCFAPWILQPTIEENGGAVLIQLPILRAFTVGRPSVAIFALVTGFVNSLKPIRQTRAGQIDATLSGVAKAAYRRTGRFIIPAMFVTIFAWFICQFGAYDLGRVVDSQWIRDTSPKQSKDFLSVFLDLFSALRTTWTSGANDYEKVQWTLTYLLRGSMLVYLTLFATAYVEPDWRYALYGLLYCYYYTMGDAAIGINIYAGMILAEMNFTPQVQAFWDARPFAIGFMSVIAIITGLLCNSFPENKPEWAGWSRAMIEIGKVIFPRGAELARFYPALGAQLICLGVMFNKTAQRFLTSSWLSWFGRISWPVYLIHATLIRTVLTYMVYGMSKRPPSPGQDEEGVEIPQPWTPISSKWSLVIAIPIFYVLVYRLAMLWAAYVDPLCGRITNWVELKIFRQDDGEKSGPQQA